MIIKLRRKHNGDGSTSFSTCFIKPPYFNHDFLPVHHFTPQNYYPKTFSLKPTYPEL